MKLNLPNKLTLVRCVLVPLIMFFMLVPLFDNPMWSRIISAVVFLAASITDALDGNIARSRNLVTNFGKFLDPLADKLMVICSLLCLTVAGGMGYYNTGVVYDLPIFGETVFDWSFLNPVLMAWVTAIVIMRELAVTSLRLVVAAGDEKIVVAANWMGKLKMIMQTVFVMTALLEPVIFPWLNLSLTWICLVIMVVSTVVSGFDYIRSYWKFINPSK